MTIDIRSLLFTTLSLFAMVMQIGCEGPSNPSPNPTGSDANPGAVSDAAAGAGTGTTAGAAPLDDHGYVYDYKPNVDKEQKAWIQSIYAQSHRPDTSYPPDVGLTGRHGYVTDESGRITGVNFNYTPATMKDLERLSAISTIKDLRLMGTKITNGDLPILKKFPDLEKVSLSATEISDEGIEALKELKGLKSLAVNTTKITLEGMKELQAALPDCDVY